jgi:Asp-tRNA(Asn)/Glu-tRNA(Gln) amidotransferase B subunit
MSKEKKSGNYKVDSEIKRKFLNTAGYKNIDSNKAIEMAMVYFIERHLPELVENESLLKALS